ncbi:P-loop containing nucleoside triphosphate hydrolase protein [Sistotremastrum suecicum HHB10207 ss-3]|uniref:p-loop containing nucleoside triphosphate hydrolase protein n=1 Tax=Sistotremastrum suecicum HHB10207 ss-3 TaxID=1314776 RepID=A0A166BIM9_9AGAM|nr:P-loop containing nucleoside triphosphate hydrolase protein [Sistotremastrum suecicum HHB10207 ss-3]
MDIVERPSVFAYWDSRALPFYLSVFSCLYLISQRTPRALGQVNTDDQTTPKVVSKERSRSRASLILQSARLIAVLAILGVSLSLMINRSDGKRTTGILLVAFSVYSVVLSLMTLKGPKLLQYRASVHLSIIHFATFILYIIRDIVPLGIGNQPEDELDGSLGWVRFGLVVVSGFLIPGLLPRGTELDESVSLAPHQTASLFSRAFYGFLDPIIWKAFKSPSLTFDEIPVLADDDRAKGLIAKTDVLLDPVSVGRQRNLFWGMLVAFKKQYAIMAAIALFQSFNGFAGPIATNRILAALEKGGSDSAVKPWVWILWLGAGPILGSALAEFSTYTQYLVVVRFQAILTQLVLTHSMRVRMSTLWKKAGPVSADAGSPHPARATAASQSASTAIAAPTVPSSTEPEAHGVSAASPASSHDVQSESTEPRNVKDRESENEEVVHDAERLEDYGGKINNFLTSDLENISSLQDWLKPFFVILRTAICVIFLYVILGWSAFVGLAVIIVSIPVPGYTSKLFVTMQKDKMKASDARLNTVNQMINALRMIKLFAWESKAETRIAEKREAELWYTFWIAVLRTCSSSVTSLFPMVAMMSTYATFTLVMGGELTASRLFSSLVVFGRLENYIGAIIWVFPGILEAKVSLDRISEFLNSGELYKLSKPEDSNADSADASTVYVRDIVFSWDDPKQLQKPSNGRHFQLQINDELKFKTGGINLICGPTASGKTSLLMGLLGEMYSRPLSDVGGYNLPREGGVAYAAQESWVLNATIKDNILFGAPFDQERFDKVIHQTGLTRDISLFEAGVLTEVGEKGITLSGGQKARITLARAVYSTAAIVLLDDVLSALDVHTARWVAEKCLGGDLLKGRTVLLVTHNVLLCKPIADYVISLSRNGTIVSQGTADEALKKNASVKNEAEVEAAALEKEEEVEVAQGSDGDVDEPAIPTEGGKLIVAEEMAVGHITWASIRLYISSVGGPLFFAVFVLGYTVWVLLEVLGTWFYGYWSSQYEQKEASEVRVHLYIGIASGIEVLRAVVFIIFYAFFMFGGVRASRSLHERLTKSILSCTIRWLDTTPVSRILTRFSQDSQSIDSSLPMLVISTTNTTIATWTYFLSAIISTGWPALLLGIVVAVFGVTCGQLYVQAQLPVKRLMSNLRAPVLGHAGAALNGLVSIRAYDAQEAFKEESLRRIDDYTRVARTYWNLNRWIALRMDSIAAIFSSAVVTYLVYWKGAPAASVGFTLVLVTSFSQYLLFWVRRVHQLEVEANSIERVKHFLEIDHEFDPKASGAPPAYWPASGELHVEHLSAKYSEDGPEALKDVTFSLRSGERLGIVGRTGAGKSTIALALLRAIPITGSVVLDGLDLSKLNLSDVRSHITIIPQDPELISGTLRENLDPFGEHEDATLNLVLRASGLYQTQDEDAEGGIGLDTDVSSGGSNFSQGQRQILALARAILRRSKLVILDEATAAIDHRTDRVIQESLRTEFKDVTVITVAHRLQTIMNSDKIMVLDAGSVIELDTPQALLKKQGGSFKALVDGSGDRDELYSAAGL